ncbi:transcription initiation factor TFIID subunit 1-like [Teleopsis dalmanni]|uniref:transcription initiation factor TFIID subunit 1-like n=1 Tax=Teleopsis dalmanni TaxID=139649 RepID=UPI0018CF05D7|nr:transcription initiation factor TFIID subunit 1-like [Teleopsis dalmanni]
MENILSSSTMERAENVKQVEMVVSPDLDVPIPPIATIEENPTSVENMVHVSEAGTSAVTKQIHKPLSHLCPERYRNVDIKTVFPDFEEGEPLNFFRLLPPPYVLNPISVLKRQRGMSEEDGVAANMCHESTSSSNGNSKGNGKQTNKPKKRQKRIGSAPKDNGLPPLGVRLRSASGSSGKTGVSQKERRERSST